MLPERLASGARGALLGTFVGDALGMPYEGMPPEAIPRRLDMRAARMGPGTYTDDTEMAINLAESLLRCDVVDPEDLARTFRAHCDLRRGYGGGTLAVMELWAQGVPVRDAARLVFDGRGSLGNGAAMRVAPVALRFHAEPQRLEEQARISAAVTHAHPEGIDGAVAQATAVAAALTGRDVVTAATNAAVTDAVRSAIEGPTPGDPTGGIPPTAAASVAAAIRTAAAPTFEQAVTDAVHLGGDTDTVAAMTGAIAGARLGAAAIPPRWLEALEDGARGRAHVIRLADALAARAIGARGCRSPSGD